MRVIYYFRNPVQNALKRNKFEYIIPVLLALVITVGLVKFIPLLHTGYQLTLTGSETVVPDYYRVYADLDGDGNSEQLNIHYNAAGSIAVSVNNHFRATINQFNFPGKFSVQDDIFDLEDLNGDGITDILVFSEVGDSLYLNIIDDIRGRPTRTERYFVDLINQYNRENDYKISPGKCTDLDGDGSSEYVFGINGGHALQPRRVYAVDYRTGTVTASPLSGAAVVSLGFFDLDDDGSEEILVNTVAPDNFKIPFPYRDSVTWLMVLDNDLQFYRPPELFFQAPSHITMEPFIHEDGRYLLVYSRYRGERGYNSVVSIYDHSLVRLKSLEHRGHDHNFYGIWREPGSYELSEIRLLRGNGIFTVDFDLRIRDSLVNRSNFWQNMQYPLDIDGDGSVEYVQAGSGSLDIFSSELKQTVHYGDFPVRSQRPRILVSLKESQLHRPELFIQVDSVCQSFTYGVNPWFKYRGMVYPGIFLLLFSLFMVWVVIQNRLVSRRYEKDRLISRLQMQAIRNQLDPHFTYNALNAVGSLIYKEDKDLAYRYLKGLTDLMRMVSLDSTEITWTLEEELGFVQKYLAIEKLRFREKFNYRVTVEEERLNGLHVPKMGVLTFVENSIKHGLRHKHDDRNLEITVTTRGSGMGIMIVDNGIGREASARLAEETAGNGIGIMSRYFRQFNEATGMKARFDIHDLYDRENKPAGTNVEICIQ